MFPLSKKKKISNLGRISTFTRYHDLQKIITYHRTRYHYNFINIQLHLYKKKISLRLRTFALYQIRKKFQYAKPFITYEQMRFLIKKMPSRLSLVYTKSEKKNKQRNDRNVSGAVGKLGLMVTVARHRNACGFGVYVWAVRGVCVSMSRYLRRTFGRLYRTYGIISCW